MLLQLRVQDFALIDEVDLRLEPGLNVLTGETGAGKSILIDAIGLLLGQRANPADVRSGARLAYVEGIFAGELPAAAAELLREHGVEPEDPLVVSREIAAAGRSVARVGGRALPARVLVRLGRRLIDVHGQSEHQSLFQRARQLEYLDHYGGLLDARRAVAELVDRLRAVRAEMRELQRDRRSVAREIDLLTFQAEEVEEARLDPEEDAALRAEQQKLAHAERLRELAAAAGRLIEGEDPAGAMDLLARAQSNLEEIASLDTSAAALQAQINESGALLAELSRDLRSYADGVDVNPQRLAEVDGRLDLIETLKRKYGDTLAEVLAYGTDARRRLERLVTADDRLQELVTLESELAAELAAAARELSEQRAEVAGGLAGAIVRELEQLNLPSARFETRLDARSDPEGLVVPGRSEPVAFDASGIDAGEFFLSVNVGQPLRPLAQVASGGETSRILLGLKAVLASSDEIPTLVFDEIDIGVGTRAGDVVGQKLAGLARTHQVLCVTHLPTVAAFADAHYVVEKQVRDGQTTTHVQRLTDQAVVQEIAAMSGARTAAGKRLADDLLARARDWKRERVPADAR